MLTQDKKSVYYKYYFTKNTIINIKKQFFIDNYGFIINL